jgi:hypothetical protein
MVEIGIGGIGQRGIEVYNGAAGLGRNEPEIPAASFFQVRNRIFTLQRCRVLSGLPVCCMGQITQPDDCKIGGAHQGVTRPGSILPGHAKAPDNGFARFEYVGGVETSLFRIEGPIAGTRNRRVEAGAETVLIDPHRMFRPGAGLFLENDLDPFDPEGSGRPAFIFPGSISQYHIPSAPVKATHTSFAVGVLPFGCKKIALPRKPAVAFPGDGQGIGGEHLFIVNRCKAGSGPQVRSGAEENDDRQESSEVFERRTHGVLSPVIARRSELETLSATNTNSGWALIDPKQLFGDFNRCHGVGRVTVGSTDLKGKLLGHGRPAANHLHPASDLAFLDSFHGGLDVRIARGQQTRDAYHVGIQLNGLHYLQMRTLDFIENWTHGRVKFERYSADEIVPGYETWNAVKRGVIPTGVACTCYTMKTDWNSGMYCTAPGLGPVEKMAFYHGTKDVQDSKNYETEVWKLLEKTMMDKYGVQVMPSAMQTTETFVYSTKPINSIEDLKKLKIRSVGVRGDVFKYAGCSVVGMPAGGSE